MSQSPTSDERLATAIAALRRCEDAIGEHQHAGDKDRLRETFREALADVATLARLDRLQPRTQRRVREFQRHESELVALGYEPGQRRKIICRRLGISRTRYYELRQLAESDRNTGLLGE